MSYHSGSLETRRRPASDRPGSLPLVLGPGIAVVLSIATFLIMGSLSIWLRNHYGLDGRLWFPMLGVVGFAMGLSVLVSRWLCRRASGAALSVATAAPAVVIVLANLWLTSGSVDLTLGPALSYAVALMVGMAGGLAVAHVVSAR